MKFLRKTTQNCQRCPLSPPPCHTSQQTAPKKPVENSDLARAGTGCHVHISEAVGILEMQCWRQVAAAARGIMPSEMRLRGSRSRGGLKGTRGAFKGRAHRNWGSRNSGAWRAPELNGEAPCRCSEQPWATEHSALLHPAALEGWKNQHVGHWLYLLQCSGFWKGCRQLLALVVEFSWLIVSAFFGNLSAPLHVFERLEPT